MVLVVIVAGFLLAAADIVLAIHLIKHVHDEHHDRANCPICHHLFNNTDKTIIVTKPVSTGLLTVTYVFDFYEDHIQLSFYDPFRPRPPPALNLVP